MSVSASFLLVALPLGTAFAQSAKDSSASNLREFDVVGARAQSSAPTRKVDTVTLGVLGKASWQETPYSIQTITSERLRNQQGSSLTDVLKAQPSVQSQTGGSRVTDYFTSRGFTSSVWTNNTSVEGLLSHNPVEPVEDKERVEVMNGPNSFLYGVTSPGGMVNSVLKRPTDKLLLRATVGDYGGAQDFVHADVGGSAGPVGYRANLVYVGKGETGVEDQTHERSLASVALDWKILSGLVWSVDASAYRRDVEHSQSIWMIGTATKVPDAPDAGKNWGSSAGFAKDDYQRAGTRLSWRPLPDLNVRGDVRYNQFSREYVLLRRVLSGDTGYSTRVDYQGSNRNVNPQGDVLADFTLATGPVEQTLTAGYVADYLKVESPSSKATKTYTAPKAIYANGSEYPTIPLFDTIVNGGSPYRVTEETDSRSAIFMDRISIGKYVKVFAGVNYASIVDRNWNASTGVASVKYDKSALTPSGALVVSPWSFLSFYVSYIQALQKGATAPSDTTCTNAGQTLDPYLSYQFEGGAKASLGGLNLQLSAFRIDQANSYNDSIAGTKKYTLTEDGREVHTGIEFTAMGKLLESLSLSLGATWLDASIEKTSTPALKDNAPQGVAETMGKFGLEWAVPLLPGLFVNGAVNYTGKEWVDQANALSIPSVLTGDVGVRYELPLARHVLALRGTVTNLTGENFWTTRAGILYLGDPRTFLASAEFAW